MVLGRREGMSKSGNADVTLGLKSYYVSWNDIYFGSLAAHAGSWTANRDCQILYPEIVDLLLDQYVFMKTM